MLLREIPIITIIPITKIQMSIASYTSRYEIAHEVHL